MSRLDVSVAIATRDRPGPLARCLDALRAGVLQPLEVVVVDQGTSRETEGVVRARADALPGLRHVRQETRGLSASRNLALRETRGAVLAVTDDDCVPEPGWLAAIVAALEEDSSLAGVTGPMLPLGPEQPGLVAVSSRTSTVREEHRGRVAPWVVGTGGNMAVRREWLDRVGGFDERLGVGSPGGAGEDVALLDRLLAAGAVIGYEPAAVVRHERRPRASQRATRWSYGRGVGATAGILLREREARALVLLLRWLALRARLALRGVFRGRPRTAVDELRVLGGTAAGLLYGIRRGGRS